MLYNVRKTKAKEVIAITIEHLWETFLHLDRFLNEIIALSPIWAYLAIFIVIYSETAFVITSFLPSDVVLFTASSLMMVQKSFNPFILIPLFFTAAILGDSTNFSIGRLLRKHVQKTGKIFFIKKENLDKTNLIFAKSGGTSVIIARFVPLLRSLVPFVTGVSKKDYSWFLLRNLLGVGIWTVVYCGLGIFFGNFKFVKSHFGLVTIGICCLTLLTALISFTIKKLILERHGSNEKSTSK